MTLFDMHCHLDFMDDAVKAATRAEALGIGCYSVTVTPGDFERTSQSLARRTNVRVGLGLHPWWIADGRCREAEIARFEELARETRFIGEVGLDFGKRCAGTEGVQASAFDRVVAACSHGGKVLSLHAVNAADAVLDALERNSCFDDNACVFHWFSGTSDQLQRAIAAGCYFSIGLRMLATKRGREYAKVVPASKLLLETDAPPEPDSGASYDELAEQLRETLEQIELLRGRPLADRVAQTSRELLFPSR